MVQQEVSTAVSVERRKSPVQKEGLAHRWVLKEWMMPFDPPVEVGPERWW